jgi:amino acid transporter
LKGTGSVGESLILWAFGGLVATCGLLVWLELGLTIPLRIVPGHANTGLKGVPRSGGEKNYVSSACYLPLRRHFIDSLKLEFIYSDSCKASPKFLVTCMYGIRFILLGSLPSEAVAFGSYVMSAAGRPDPARGSIVGLALGAITMAVLLHVGSWRGSILMSNWFASIKVLFLVAIIILGFTAQLNGVTSATENFDIHSSFSTDRHKAGGAGGFFSSLCFILYTYSGFEQPFYVLSEVAHPRKTFPRSTLFAMLLTTILFVLVNIAYLCAVPKDSDGLPQAHDMATLFFSHIFGDRNTSRRAADGIIAISIFGNILVATFTAARVNQEIAKEGILPFSLFFATSHPTPSAWLQSKMKPPQYGHGYREHTPMAALGLHWLVSVILIGATSMVEPATAYIVLMLLHSYTVVIVNGFLVSGGLLYLKLKTSTNWRANANFSPWIDPLHAVFYCTVCGVLIIAVFLKPPVNWPSEDFSNHVKWFIVPTVGLLAIFLGVIWFFGLHLLMLGRGKELVVFRTPLILVDVGGQWVQIAELVDVEWHVKLPTITFGVEEHGMM